MITVITGPMFAGKSSKLIEIYSNKYNTNKIQAFKPSKDIRDKTYIKCRQYLTQIEAKVVKNYQDILNNINLEKKVIMIDEAQFIEGDPRILLDLSLIYNYEIYVAGLALDSEQNPFGSFPHLMALADKIEYVESDCYYCGRKAIYTRYIGEKSSQIKVGSNGYIPVCKHCLKEEI